MCWALFQMLDTEERCLQPMYESETFASYGYDVSTCVYVYMKAKTKMNWD